LQADGANIDVVYAHNDDMALGVIQAISEYGLRPGVDIIVVSIDAVKGAVQALLQGTLNCTVECSPYHGPAFFDAAERIHRGEQVPKVVYLEDRVLTAEKAADLRLSEVWCWGY